MLEFDRMNHQSVVEISKPGMTLANNQIHQGDCVTLLNKLDAGTVDLVFADPPFNIGYEYDVYDDRQHVDDYLGWCRQWIEGVYRALKPDGTFWLAIGDEYAAELKIEAQRIGFHCRSWVIWYYTFGVNCTKGFSRSHTHLFHFVKDPRKFTFNRANPQIRVKSARQLVYADRRANPDGRLPDNTWITRPQDAPLSFSPSHDTWYFARVAGTFKEREGFHGCQMPEQLLARIIRSTSQPGDLVLDPFGGSGTTLTVAKKLARHWIGFELSEDYVRYIAQRLEKTSVGDPLDGAEDPIESAPHTAAGKRRKAAKDADAERVVMAAFKRVAQGVAAGRPACDLLCDPDLSAAFLEECSQAGLKGSAFFVNQLLLGLDEAGQLPQSGPSSQRISDEDLDRYGYASEVAWRLMEIDYAKSLDEVLCSPEAASEFDRLAKLYGPVDATVTPREFRLAAVEIRQRYAAARQVAAQAFPNWVSGKNQLADAPLSNTILELAFPGVVALLAGDNPVLVLETDDIQRRVEQVLANPSWRALGLDRVQYVREDGASDLRWALKAASVQNLKPLLNCRLLI
jgi:site-specific DNA-methyltransferase (adenine-specific)